MNPLNTTRKEEYYQIIGRNLFLKKEFFIISDCCKQENIALIPLKGIALIQRIYADMGQRYIGDIDILIKSSDVPRTCTVLEKLGYQCGHKDYFNPRRPFNTYLNSLAFYKQTSIPYFIHVHWHLLNSTFPLFMYTIDMEKVWAAAQEEQYEKGSITMLAAAHQVVYLSVHAFNHSFDKRSLLIDIQKVIEFYKDRLDWKEVIVVAKQWNAVVPLYYALYFTCQQTNASIPKGVLATLAPKRASRTEKKITGYILKTGRSSDNLVYPMYLNMCGSLWRKTRFIFSHLLPPPFVLARMYSEKSSSLLGRYYFKRLGAMFTQYMRFLKDVY